MHDLTAGERANFLDQPLSAEELVALGERWTNYRILTNSATFGSKHDGGYGYYERRWLAHRDTIVQEYAARWPGMRPSAFFRFEGNAYPPDRADDAVWQILDKHKGWVPGEREAAIERFGGPLQRRRETCRDAPRHPDFDHRGRRPNA